MTYTVYIAYLLITLIGAGTMAALAFHGWSRRAIPGARTFAWLMADFALTSLCYILMGISQTEEALYFWARLRYLGLATIPVLFLLFVLEDHEKTLWLRRAPFLFIVPAITQALIWTNDWHGTFFAEWNAQPTEITLVESVIYGDSARLHAVYSFLMITTGLVLLLGRVLNSRGVYRKQAALLLTGAILAVGFNVMHTMGLVRVSTPNLTPFGFAGAALFFTIALFRYKLLDLVPVAFDTVYKSMKDPVFVFSDQKRLVAVNPAAEKLMMLSEQQLLGKHAYEVFFRYPDLVNQYLDVAEAHAEIVLPLRNGDQTYELLISPIYQSHNHLAGRLVVLRDITERIVASRRDFELNSERERTRLLASFIQYSSHDLRTPLSKMNMSLHIARRTDDPQKRLEKLDAIEREILRMTSIIEEMHLLTRLESGTPITLKPVSLDQIVQLTPADIQQIIIEKRLSLRLPQESNVLVCGDMDLLRQAFRGLLHNAALYTPEDGSITVSIYAQHPWGMIEVIDTGMGIEGEQLELIFEHFAKVNAARTSDGSGAGLGLAIVKKVMEVHHGRVTVLSSPGQGSTFCLLLPLPDVAASPQQSDLTSSSKP